MKRMRGCVAVWTAICLVCSTSWALADEAKKTTEEAPPPTVQLNSPAHASELLKGAQWEKVAKWFPFYILPDRTARGLAQKALDLGECQAGAEAALETLEQDFEVELAQQAIDLANLVAERDALEKALSRTDEGMPVWQVTLIVLGTFVVTAAGGLGAGYGLSKAK